jgi:hypothetical protein
MRHLINESINFAHLNHEEYENTFCKALISNDLQNIIDH